MGTGFCDDSVLHGPTTPYTMERVTLIVPWSKSTLPHFKPNNSLCRNPVDAARGTNVRSLCARPLISALISAGIKMAGAVRRFALLRTREIVVGANKPYLDAVVDMKDLRTVRLVAVG